MTDVRNSGYLIGIDTGGTYTDAAIIDQAQHRVLATAKAITTKGDLAVGVSEAMDLAIAKLDSDFRIEQVKLVSVSTTLATNAVVEGHGSAVGVILIGFDAAMVERTGIAKSFPGVRILQAAGGHEHNGEEQTALDEKAILNFVSDVNSEVSAFAISSSFAGRNPEHEQRARQIIASQTQKPTTVSTELSTALDAPRRALTAVLNARLISRVTQLVEAMRRAMALKGISCPLMIVKGDGSLANAEIVAARPIETVLSGPAASLVGARWLSGCDDFIMSDIGGTTTDIGILSGGRPRVAENGAEVAGWRTMVKAIDVKTIGLGGDSEVQLEFDGSFRIGPQRAVPVSLLGQKYPHINAVMEADLSENEGGSMHGRFVCLPFGAHSAVKAAGLTAREIEIYSEIEAAPLPLRKIATSSSAQRAIAALRKRGLIQFSAFTPSDAAHVLGLQANWSKDSALLAARLMTRFKDMKAPTDARVKDFCQDVWHKTVSLSARVVLDAAFGAPVRSDILVESVCEGRAQQGLVAINLSPQVPIVAVGGPARIYYEEVARRLNCEVLFVPHCDVANAVGAAAGTVSHRVVITVEGDGNGAFRVLGAGAAEVFGSGSLAVQRALDLASAQATTMAKEQGGIDPRIVVSTQKHFLPDMQNDDGLLSAVVTAEAIAKASA
jgi:N-methylhydantoinase A/oxoprolinase/acetone carboxylase beta subunit